MDLETGARSCADIMLTSRSWNGEPNIDIVLVLGNENNSREGVTFDGGGVSSPLTSTSDQTSVLSL